MSESNKEFYQRHADDNKALSKEAHDAGYKEASEDYNHEAIIYQRAADKTEG